MRKKERKKDDRRMSEAERENRKKKNVGVASTVRSLRSSPHCLLRSLCVFLPSRFLLC